MRTPALRHRRNCLHSFSLTAKRTPTRIEDMGIPSLGRVAPRMYLVGNSHSHWFTINLQLRAAEFGTVILAAVIVQAENRMPDENFRSRIISGRSSRNLLDADRSQ